MAIVLACVTRLQSQPPPRPSTPSPTPNTSAVPAPVPPTAAQPNAATSSAVRLPSDSLPQRGPPTLATGGTVPLPNTQDPHNGGSSSPPSAATSAVMGAAETDGTPPTNDADHPVARLSPPAQSPVDQNPGSGNTQQPAADETMPQAAQGFSPSHDTAISVRSVRLPQLQFANASLRRYRAPTKHFCALPLLSTL